MEFEIQVQGTAQDPVVRISGDLVGNHPFPLKISKEQRTLTIEMEGFSRMNSIGVRQWDQWMGALRKENPSLIINLIEMPTFFVELFNVIHEFVPSPFVVKSFYLQYYCDQCEKSVDVLFKWPSGADFTKSAKDLLPVQCDHCGSTLQMDFNSDRIFNFLQKSSG